MNQLRAIATYLSFEEICASSSVEENEAGVCKWPEIQAPQACVPRHLCGVSSLEMGEGIAVQSWYPPTGAIGLE